MLDKTFKPSNFEKKHYENWLNKKYFKAEVNKDKKPFTIIMPPPNITSKLHIGHAYGIAIMDTITRFKRMQGYEALLLPGCDHAAIATEAKVVDKLAKQGIHKQDLGREKFMEKMYEWYDEFGTQINQQFELVGISADWERYAFTLDEPRAKSVREAFVRLYEKGLIYQKDRITNWCVSCKTAISDIEVEYEEHDGHIWYLRYPIENSDKFVELATTRPETMLGDVAVAVNPNDERYKDLVGKNVILPLVNKTIPVIADEYVEMDFGTGVVKITPAHDPNDYEVGLRHNLEVLSVFNQDGTINDIVPNKYVGLDRFVARKEMLKDLQEQGYLIKTEHHKNNVGHCQRCHETIEPMVTKQWYVDMKQMAQRAIKVVKDGEIKFMPKRFEKIYYNWMENIQDWCISRQIWSGHRIPVFYCEDCGATIVEREDPTECPHCHSKHIVQDTDSLDTWFSSALWPFSTLGWPEKAPELDYFFPTNLMVTAYDIIFFWVARMIFSSLEYTDKIPFEDVLMHGLIRDAQGRKMSKSLGNGIDPIDIIDKYGADTLRFALLQGVGIGQDSRFSVEKAESVSNFLNKLWNASRFVLDNVDKVAYQTLDLNKINQTYADKWILTELNQMIKEVTKAYDKYDLGLVISKMYDFVWNKFCDWYIESSKVKLYEGTELEKVEVLNVLVYVLERILKLLHPLVPFITEEIYLNLPEHDESIMISKFPKVNKKLTFESEYEVFTGMMNLVKSLRNLRSEMNIADNIKTDLYLFAYKEKQAFESSLNILQKLAYGKHIKLLEQESDITDKNVFVISELGKILIPTSELIDPEKELQRLNGELAKVEAELKRAHGMLANERFVEKAPQNLIDAEKEKIAKYSELKQSILESIKLYQ